jgi:hypothetical protein
MVFKEYIHSSYTSNQLYETKNSEHFYSDQHLFLTSQTQNIPIFSRIYKHKVISKYILEYLN